MHELTPTWVTVELLTSSSIEYNYILCSWMHTRRLFLSFLLLELSLLDTSYILLIILIIYCVTVHNTLQHASYPMCHK
ncbi:hypothetical protein BU24DRAFT_36191 [Aaosphaeria arxii CBS 175.79]|uniref:Uncharacterized protein n=1 Tax=Aaosphaeria arxii CBS 175.79 TaxID=1450172 RepID=A0A6A5Y8Y2_9PLEO|nr:uncharacterized protein BU24DRAFT_36191 [Aaosphaeria arxii CBS 175.79]KAF2022045.1 hypothetical protein BU24DRAFT_36191 [Aaosphaeria arxii CBS 175.79]